jgi:hypothetical protein
MRHTSPHCCRKVAIAAKRVHPEFAIPDPGRSAGVVRHVESSQIRIAADRDVGILEGVRQARLPSERLRYQGSFPSRHGYAAQRR